MFSVEKYRARNHKETQNVEMGTKKLEKFWGGKKPYWNIPINKSALTVIKTPIKKKILNLTKNPIYFQSPQNCQRITQLGKQGQRTDSP